MFVRSFCPNVINSHNDAALPPASLCEYVSSLFAFMSVTQMLSRVHTRIHNTRPHKPSARSLLQFMDSVGNDASKVKYERLVPAFYYRPSHTDCT